MICCKGENGNTIRTPFENLQKARKLRCFCKVCIILIRHTYGKYRRTFRKEEKPSVLSDVFALVRILDPRTRFDDGAAERILTVVSIAVSARLNAATKAVDGNLS